MHVLMHKVLLHLFKIEGGKGVKGFGHQRRLLAAGLGAILIIVGQSRLYDGGRYRLASGATHGLRDIVDKGLELAAGGYRLAAMKAV